jgi:hypothetical protein
MDISYFELERLQLLYIKRIGANHGPWPARILFNSIKFGSFSSKSMKKHFVNFFQIQTIAINFFEIIKKCDYISTLVVTPLLTVNFFVWTLVVVKMITISISPASLFSSYQNLLMRVSKKLLSIKIIDLALI